MTYENKPSNADRVRGAFAHLGLAATYAEIRDFLGCTMTRIVDRPEPEWWSYSSWRPGLTKSGVPLEQEAFYANSAEIRSVRQQLLRPPKLRRYRNRKELLQPEIYEWV